MLRVLIFQINLTIEHMIVIRFNAEYFRVLKIFSWVFWTQKISEILEGKLNSDWHKVCPCALIREEVD